MPIRGAFRLATGAGSFAPTPPPVAPPTITSFTLDDITLETTQLGTFAATFGGGTLTQWTLDVNDSAPAEYSGSSAPMSQGHIYASAGTYTARLVATGPGGAAQATITNIQVTSPAPPPPPPPPPATPDVVVRGNGNVIGDGSSTPSFPDHTQFVTAVQSAGGTTRTFTVENTGGATLTTSSLTVPAGFTVTEGLAASINAGASDTFTVRLDDAVLGTKSGDISFATNVAGKNPYNFAISGVVAAAGALPPVAGFTLSTTVGDAPLSVTATDTSTNSPTSWLWHFIHDTETITSTSQNPTVVLPHVGMWSIKLWATNANGTGYTAIAQEIIVRTAGGGGYDVTYDNGTTANPLVVAQRIPVNAGTAVRISPTPPAGSVTEWRFNNYWGVSLTGNAQEGLRAVTTGLRTIGARITLPAGTDIVISKQVNVTSSGYTPIKTHSPVPTRTWTVPSGETVLTTETRYNEAASGTGKRPDRWVLAFDPGEVASGETLMVRDDAGNEINWGMVEQATHDDGSLASCKIVCWIDVPVGGSRTYWILKRTGSRVQGACPTTNADVVAALGGTAQIILDDVRHAENQAIQLGMLTCNISTAITAAHAQRQNECPLYYEIKTSAFYRNSVPADTKVHALIFVEVWRHPDTGVLTIQTLPCTFYAFLEDFESAQAGTTTGIRELIYKARLVVGGTTIRNFSRTVSFAPTAINTTTNQIDLVGHSLKADDFVRWLPVSTLPSVIEADTCYPIKSLGYLGRYEDTVFALRAKTSFNRDDPNLDFTDQGSGTHIVETYIYQCAGKGWAAADIDGRWLVLTGDKSHLIPNWYRDEMVWRIQRGMFPPLDLDIPDDGGEPDLPAEYFTYYAGTNSVERPNRDNPGGDDMIGPIHRIGARAMRMMGTAMGRQALQAVRVGALENLSLSQMALFSNRLVSGAPAYLPEVLNNGPNDAGAAFPGMGPSRPGLALHPNFYDPGNNGVRIGVRQQHNLNSMDCSHPGHTHWQDYPLSGSRPSLDILGIQVTRSKMFWSGTSITISGTPYFGGILILNAEGWQGRAAGYWTKFLSSMLYIGDARPERAYWKKTIDNNVAALDAYLADPNEMAPFVKKTGVNTHSFSAKGGDQSWWMHIVSMGGLFLLKRRGVFLTKPAQVNYLTTLARLLAGDMSEGETLDGHPGFFAGINEITFSSRHSSSTPYGFHDFKPAMVGTASSLKDLIFDSNETVAMTAGNPTLVRNRTNHMPRKMFNGMKVKPVLMNSTAWPAPFVTSNYYYICNASADGTTYQLSSTWPSLTVITPSANSAACRMSLQPRSRGSSAGGYASAGSRYGEPGEYDWYAQTVVCCAAVWGRTEMIPHARILMDVARSSNDDIGLASSHERGLNNAPLDLGLRFHFAPSYPPL